MQMDISLLLKQSNSLITQDKPIKPRLPRCRKQFGSLRSFDELCFVADTTLYVCVEYASRGKN